MGANMLIATVRDYHERTLEDLEARIDALTMEDAAALFLAVEGQTYDEVMSYEPEDDETVLTHVQGKLRFAVNAIRGGERDVAYVEYAGAGYTVKLWITGGPSWGDDPTEVYSPFMYLEYAAIM